MEHDCLDDNNIEWNEEPVASANDLVYKGKCKVCGREFEEVYIASGIWDIKKEEYVREY